MEPTTSTTLTCPFTGVTATAPTAKKHSAPSDVADDPNQTTDELPVADWVQIADLHANPYSVYRRLREESPVAWVPAINKVLITSYSGCLYAEQHPEIFSSDVTGAHMIRAFGHQPMIRKDGSEHSSERNVINSTLRPKKISGTWEHRFGQNTSVYLEQLAAAGPGADLNQVFAAPLAAKNLIDLLGLEGVAPTDLARWSADFMAGAGNVIEDPTVWERCERSRAEVHAALDEALPRLRTTPDESITSLLLHSSMSDHSVRANVILAISGGVSEPQHITTSSVALLSENPLHLDRARQDPRHFGKIFQETVRFHSPISMVTRQTRSHVEVDGYLIPANSQVGLVLASANRDANQHDLPDTFNPERTGQRHLGFGSGAHICAGKWAAEAAVGSIAIPALYTRFPQLRTNPNNPGTWNGWVFRGYESLPVIW